MINSLFRAALVWVIVLFLSGSGCAPPKEVIAPTPPPERIVAPKDLPAEAERAWQQGDMELAEELYSRLLARDDLQMPLRIQAWQRLALAAVENGHPDRAQEALTSWSEVDPDALDTWAYHLAMFKALEVERDDGSAEAHLTRLLLSPDRPEPLRRQAATFLTDRFWQQRHFGPAFQIQHEIHAQSEDNATRLMLEEEMLLRLKELDTESFAQATQALVPDRPGSHPYALVLWEEALRRLDQAPTSWPQVWSDMNRIAQQADLQILPRLRTELGALESRLGRPSQGLALLLPMSGRYAPVAWKILAGANLAHWLAIQEGSSLELTVINSESPDWMNQVARLPETTTLVGGPLQRSVWDQILAAGLEQNRAFFTFLPSLEGDLEGSTAWRFFPSPRDQAAALTEAAASELGVSSVAVLYPADRFGRGMSEIFWQEAAARGMSVTGLESYPPGEPTRWTESVRKLLRASEDEEQDLFRPHPDFKAVFIPDTLSSAQLMVPNFFYLDEDRLYILGPELWSQALSRGEDLEQHYFQLAVTPGAWWPDNPSPGTRTLFEKARELSLETPDFWMALGFDFIRFAQNIGTLPWDWEARTVNTLLAASLGLDWSMAPMSWTMEGKATQKLFLFQPRSGEIRPASFQALRHKAASVAAKHQDRLKTRIKELNATVPGHARDYFLNDPFLSNEGPAR